MEKENSSGRITCDYCIYAIVDDSTSEGNWTAYECANSKSEYHHALLNVDRGGHRFDEISWVGCDKAVEY